MTDFRPIIADLDAYGFGVNKIALRLGRQFTEIKRIKDKGRAEHGLGELIEIDGAAHRIKSRFMDDILKNQEAVLNGYYLLRVATSQVRNGEGVIVIGRALRRIKAYGPTFHVAPLRTGANQ